jgi:ATP-dependent protease HslVU (ClpYQ) ATPase subunit
MKRSLLLGFYLILTVGHLFGQEVGSFYRYSDDNGNVVISRSIPADKVSGGYEVLSGSGRVVETVERQLTDDEITAYSERKRKDLDDQAIKSKQREYDLQLLRRYSFVEDIESEKSRKLDEMDVRIQILKGNLISVRNELEVAYQNAANFEKRGRVVPESSLSRIADLEAKLTATEQLMKKLKLEMDSTRREYLTSILRFKQLKPAND